MLPRALLLACAATLLAACASTATRTGASTGAAPDDLGAWREHLLPTADELAFEAVPWLPSFREGVRAGDAQERPVLLWAMNGHPLGCT